MGFQSPLGLRKRIRKRLNRGSGKDDDSKKSTDETEGVSTIDESIDDEVPFHEGKDENVTLTRTEFKLLKKEAHNMCNLGKLYANTDKPKSRDCFLRSIQAQEKVITSLAKKDVKGSSRDESMQELADINEKLGAVEVSMDFNDDAIDRYSSALDHYQSLPNSSTIGKGTKPTKTKEESIERLKSVLTNLDPSFSFLDANVDQEQADDAVSVSSAPTYQKTIVKKENSKDDDDDDDDFSIVSDHSDTEDEYEPIEFPKINDEDYHLAEIKCSEADYREAIEYYKTSYDTFTNTKSDSHTSAHEESTEIISGVLLEKTAMCYALLSNYTSSKKYFQDGIAVLDKHAVNRKNGKDNKEWILGKTLLFRIYLRLAKLHLDYGHSEDAIDCYVKAFPALIETKRTVMNDELTTQVQNCIFAHEETAKKSIKRGNSKDALLHYKVMFTLMEIYMNQGNMYKSYIRPYYISVAKSIGAIYMEMEKLDLAFNFFYEFIKTYTSNDEDKRDARNIATIYYNMGVLIERKQDYPQALLFYFKSLERKRKIFVKPKDVKEKLSRTVKYMAFVYMKLDDEEMALQFFKEAIDLCDMDAAKSNYNEYALVYSSVSSIHAKRDEIDDAIHYMIKKIELADRCSDSDLDSEDLADGYHSMGLLYSYKKNYGQAIECYKKAYELKNVLRSKSKTSRKSMFLTLRNLSHMYDASDEQEDALKSYQDCLLYADEVVDRLSTFNNIGVLLCKKDESLSAMEFYNKALEDEHVLSKGMKNENDLRKIDVDKNNKQKLHIALLNNTGNCVSEITEDVKTAKGYYSKASDIWSSNQYLKIMSSIISTDALPSNNTIYNAGIMYMKKLDFINAVDSFLEYLRIKGHDNSVSNMNPKEDEDTESLDETAAALNFIGNIKYHQGLYKESIDFFTKSLSFKKSRYGPNSSKLASILSNLGTAYYQLKQYDSAQENIQLAFSLLKISDDQNHLQLFNKKAFLSNKIGNIRVKQGDDESALTTYQQAYESLQDEDHPCVLLLKHNIALVHARKGNLDEALTQLQSIQERNLLALGKGHLTIVKLNLDICGIYYRKKLYREARKLCEASISQLKKTNLPENHLYVQQAQKTFEKIDIAQQWNLF